MNTSKVEKIERELMAEEAKLLQLLLRILPEAAESGAGVSGHYGLLGLIQR